MGMGSGYQRKQATPAAGSRQQVGGTMQPAVQPQPAKPPPSPTLGGGPIATGQPATSPPTGDWGTPGPKGETYAEGLRRQGFMQQAQNQQNQWQQQAQQLGVPMHQLQAKFDELGLGNQGDYRNVQLPPQQLNAQNQQAMYEKAMQGNRAALPDVGGTGQDPAMAYRNQIAQERAAQAGQGLTDTERTIMDNFRNSDNQYGSAWQGLQAMSGDAFGGGTSASGYKVGTPEQARARRELLAAARRKPTARRRDVFEVPSGPRIETEGRGLFDIPRG